MAIQRLPIREFLFRAKGHLVLDVRSPGEYSHAHMPGAVSFPLFTDEERKTVGTAYKQEGREPAIKIGLDLFGPKMRKMVEQVETLTAEQGLETSTAVREEKELQPPARTIYLYCWRGGMRSAAIAWLLDLYGFRVFTLAGGYKSFRNHVLQCFRLPYSFKILGGYTGSGKTEVLQKLEQLGEPVIDLETLASHKGSAFGALNMPPQPTQEMFENILAADLEKKSVQAPGAGTSEPARSIWLEDESQRIGNLNIPGAIWEKMRKTAIIFLEIDFEERLKHLAEEYAYRNNEKLIESVIRITKRLGGLEARNAIGFLEENNKKEAFRILLHYYDKQYIKGLHNRENLSTLLTRISCEKVSAENARLLTKYQPV